MRYQTLARRLLSLLVTASLGVCCAPILADSDVADSDFPDNLWSKHARLTELHLISPSMMNDDQLLEAAQLIREGKGSESQRVLNNAWLNMESSKQYEGARALGQILSLGFFSYKRELTLTELNNPLISTLSALNEESLITHFDRYEIEVSSKSLILSYRLDI